MASLLPVVRNVEEIALPARSLAALLDQRVAQTPEKLSYSDRRERVTWREFGARVDALALALHEEGVKPGDRVAVMGPTSGEWAVADLAILAAGAISVGVYSSLAPRQVGALLDDC